MPADPETLALLRDIVSRLTRLEDRVAGGACAPTPRPAAKPLRVSKAQAAETLGLSTREVNRHMSRGLLLPLGKKSAKARVFFDPLNVAALAVSEEAARAWVEARKYVPHGRRR